MMQVLSDDHVTNSFNVNLYVNIAKDFWKLDILLSNGEFKRRLRHRR